MKRSDAGSFITIEGGEGSGKSTLIDRLYAYLTDEKEAFGVKTFEPGGPPFGTLVREKLLDKHELQMSSKSELFLFLADRAHHVETLIKPALEQNMIVLCDRFTDSSLAYQGGARKIAQIDSKLEEVCLFATGGLVPDLTFYLDIDPEKGLERITGGKDRLEKEHISFHKQVRESYLMLAKKYPKRFAILDADRSTDEVFQEAVEILRAKKIRALV